MKLSCVQEPTNARTVQNHRAFAAMQTVGGHGKCCTPRGCRQTSCNVLGLAMFCLGTGTCDAWRLWPILFRSVPNLDMLRKYGVPQITVIPRLTSDPANEFFG